MVRVCILAGLVGLAAYLLGQYYPVFSNVAVQVVCEPLSPCRTQVAHGYALGGALTGLVIGLLSLLVEANKKNQKQEEKKQEEKKEEET